LHRRPKVPFDAPGLNGLVTKIVRAAPPPLPPAFSAPLRALCAEALAKSPRARPRVHELLRRGVLRERIQRFLDQATHHVPRRLPSPY